MGKIEKEYIQFFPCPVQNLRDIFIFFCLMKLINIVHAIYFNKCDGKSFQHLELCFALFFSFCFPSIQTVLNLFNCVSGTCCILVWNSFTSALNERAIANTFCLMCRTSVIFPLVM